MKGRVQHAQPCCTRNSNMPLLFLIAINREREVIYFNLNRLPENLAKYAAQHWRKNRQKEKSSGDKKYDYANPAAAFVSVDVLQQAHRKILVKLPYIL